MPSSLHVGRGHAQGCLEGAARPVEETMRPLRRTACTSPRQSRCNKRQNSLVAAATPSQTSSRPYLHQPPPQRHATPHTTPGTSAITNAVTPSNEILPLPMGRSSPRLCYRDGGTGGGCISGGAAVHPIPLPASAEPPAPRSPNTMTKT